VPVVFRGEVGSARELEELTSDLGAMPSAFGGEREGVVARFEEEIPGERFAERLGKWVRQNHVKTSEHWLRQAIRVQPLSSASATMAG
jgi:hypothetical protein